MTPSDRSPVKLRRTIILPNFTSILDLLDEEHTNILCQSYLCPLYSLRDIRFSGQLLDVLLCRPSKPVDGDAFQFDLRGKVAMFFIFEFALITVLQCTDKEVARARILRTQEAVE